MSDTPVASATPSTESSSTDQSESTESAVPQSEAKTDPKSQDKPTKAEVKEAVRKFKIKIDDQEQEVEETELIRGYQTRKAADKRFQEAAKLRKESDALIKLLREDPVKALSHPAIGHDVRKMAEEILAKQIEEEMMSPEQKELKRYKEELEMLKKSDEERKSEADRIRLDQLTAHYEQEYTKKITEALESSGLPKTNHTVKRMAYYMNEAVDRGYDLEPRDMVELVRNDYLRDIKDLLGASDGQVLVDLLGDDVAKKIRKFDLEKLKTIVPNDASKSSSREPSVQKEKKKITMDEFNEYMKSIKNS